MRLTPCLSMILLVFSLFLLPILASAEPFPVTMEEGEERTFTLGDRQYELEVMIIEDATPATVTFNINGEVTPQLVAQAHYTLKDGTLLDVLDIWLNEAGEAGSGDTVTFSLSFCGDTVCNGEENSQSCAKDCGPQENTGLLSYTLENALLRFVFDENGSLQTISHKPSDYMYTLQQQQPWQVSIYNALRSSEIDPPLEKPIFVFIGNTDNLQECTVQSSGIQRITTSQRLEYRWICSFASPDNPQKSILTVTTSYELQDTKDYLETWSTTSITSPKYSVFKLYYPLGVVEDSSVMEYGITSGYVFEATREPAYNVVPFESYSLHNVLGGQWNDRGHYLYFMTDDDGYGMKHDSYTAENGVFTTNMILLAQNYFEPGNSIDAPYRLRIGVGKGLSGEEGWLPIADAYRQHLQEKGSLAIPIDQRNDIPDFVKNLDLTLFNGAMPYPLSSEEQQQLATVYHDATAYYGAKNVNLLLWENGKMIPFYEPQPTQVDFYRALRGVGILPCIYTVFSRVPLHDLAYESIKDEANYISPWLQKPAKTSSGNGEELVFFDPHSEKFITWFTSRLQVLNDNGKALGCVYQDDTYTVGGESNGLWNPVFNQQRKQGISDDILRGGVQYYGKIGTAMNQLDEDFFLFHESFVASANFVGGPDAQSSRGLLFGSNAHPNQLQQAVQHFFFLERVFSGYNIRKGAATESSNLLIQHPFVLAEYRNLDPRLANYPFDIYDDYPLAVAVGVLQGGGIPITPEYGIAIDGRSRQLSTVPNYLAAQKLDWTIPYFRTFLPLEAKFIKEMVRVVQLGRLYFQGQWQLPLETDSPKDEHKFITWGTTSYDIFSVQEPRVINSVWKAWNGELGLFFANTHRQEEQQVVTFYFDFSRYGLERGKNYDLVALDNTTTSPLGEQILGTFDDDFSYTFTLPSLRATVFTLRLSGNKPPQVNAGPDQTITLPTNQINLDGTVTDDGLPNPPGTVTTQWTNESGPGLVTFADGRAVDTIATFSQPGVYILRLTADDSALQAFDDVTIMVNPSVPFDFSVGVIPQSDTVVQAHEASTAVTVTLLGGISQQVSLAYSGCPPSATCMFDQFIGNPTFNASFNVSTSAATVAGLYEITITGTGGGLVRIASYNLTVTDSQPEASARAVPPSGVVPLIVDFSGDFTGGDAPFTYFWNFMDGSNSTLQNPQHTFSSAGSYNASFTVTDFDGDLSTDYVLVTVHETFDFDVAINPMSGTVNRDSSVKTTATATMRAGIASAVNFSASGLPSGVTATFVPTDCIPQPSQPCTSLVTFTASPTAVLGKSPITIHGTDGSITRNALPYLLTVTPRLNNPPVLDPIGSREVQQGTLLQFTVTATDPDNDTLTYDTLNLPEGATFIKQEFNWRPYERQVGYYNVTFTVTDEGIPPLSDSETVTIFVNQSSVEPDPDSDGDGVPDSQDRCPNTPPAQYQRINRLNGCPEPQLNWAKFDQNMTTNFSTVRDLLQVDDLRLGVAQKGMIHYINQSIPLVQFDSRTGRHEPLVLDAFIDIDYNMIRVDTTNATGNYTAFDRPATITLFQLSFTLPRILRDGASCDACQILSYTNGDLTFTVPGFSTYTTEETPSSGGGSSSSGGGGGGGGGGASRIAVDLDAYTQQTVSPLITGVLTLIYKNQEYQIRLSRSTSSSILLAFRSLGLTLSLELDQRTSVDLDADGVTDISIILISLQRNTATLTFARLPDSTPKPIKELRGIGEADKEVKELIEDKQAISPQKPQKGSGLLISFLLFLLGGIVLGAFFLFRSFRVRI
ncbi:PKD domain-containing protein [Candidatus Woesearchaeota archaeon]|nr:PKD domain-containing protein [Candidatus Woesearchaeota archaeon]